MKWEINKQHLYLKTQKETFRLSLLDTGAIRVQAVRTGETFNDFSYAVHRKVLTAFPKIEETASSLTFDFQKVRTVIQKNPIRVAFYTLDDEVVNKDEEAFGVRWDGEEVTNYKELQKGERFLGLGEKTGNLDRAGCQYEHWNSDVFAYGSDADPLYASIPFYIGIVNDLPYGIFLDNTSRTKFNFGASNDRFSFFSAPKGQLDYYFFYKENIPNLLKAYTDLTGRMELPPLWSLGYQQCRYSYYPDDEVLRIAETFRRKNIPADVIYLDIHYMQDYKVFTWHDERFSNPHDLIKRLAELNFKVVIIIDPGVKVEEAYEVYQSGLNENVFLQYPDGQAYKGQVWPGWCHFPDFTKPKARAWWSSYFKELVEIGVKGFWNDMNEPSVWGKHFPDLVAFDYDGQEVSHKLGHNVYGMQMSRSTMEGAKQFRPHERPFVLTRAAFAGSQRYSTFWTGDNYAGEEHLALGARLVNSLGLSGMPFAGNDVGGFVGDGSIALFTRWIALGVFTPLFRGHSMVNSRSKEPWTFGEEAEEISRNYITLRYRLLPYIYSAFHEASETGIPVSRSLAIDYHESKEVFDPQFQNQFLFGSSILVCPVLPEQEVLKVYLPDGVWYDFFNDNHYESFENNPNEVYIEAPKDKIPLFIKGSSFLALQSSIQHTDEKPNDLLEIHFYIGRDSVEWSYYEDDGISYAYEDGDYFKRSFHFDGKEGIITMSAPEGKSASKFAKIRLFLHGFPRPLVTIDRTMVTLKRVDYQTLPTISNFDPWAYEPDTSKTVRGLPYFDLENGREEIVIVL